MKNGKKATPYTEGINGNIRHIDGIQLGERLYYNKERQYIRYEDSIIKFDNTRGSQFIKFLFENPGVFHSSVYILNTIYKRDINLSLRTSSTQLYRIYAKLIETKKYKFLKEFIKMETRKKEKGKGRSFTYYKLKTI